jgi:hypothetical protein
LTRFWICSDVMTCRNGSDFEPFIEVVPLPVSYSQPLAPVAREI